MTLAELIASGRATCNVEDLQGVLSAGRCTLYEATEPGGALHDCIIRVGRRKLVALPRLYGLLGIPLPDDWLPASALAERCLKRPPGSLSDEHMTGHHEDDAGRWAGAASVVDLERARGNGHEARARCDCHLRQRDGTTHGG